MKFMTLRRLTWQNRFLLRWLLRSTKAIGRARSRKRSFGRTSVMITTMDLQTLSTWSARIIARTRFWPRTARNLRARFSAPRMDTIERCGCHCVTIRRMRANFSGAGLIIWARRASGPRWLTTLVYSIAPACRVRSRFRGRAGGAISACCKAPCPPRLQPALAENFHTEAAPYAFRTAGRPTRILLAVDRARIAPIWDDVSYVTATVDDDNGVILPNSNDLISFKIGGPGVIAAVDSADNNSHEPFQATARGAHRGRCF